MKLVTAKGRTYTVLLVWPRLIIWRSAQSSELREWPNGTVFRVLDLPDEERPFFRCTCPAAFFHPRGDVSSCCAGGRNRPLGFCG
jgi:hypothetical protein